MNTGLQAHRTSSFVTQNHPLTQILFVPERLWILFCFWLSITRKGQSLSFADGACDCLNQLYHRNNGKCERDGNGVFRPVEFCKVEGVRKRSDLNDEGCEQQREYARSPEPPVAFLILKTEPCKERILNAWKISAIESVRNAIDEPSISALYAPFAIASAWCILQGPPCR